MTNGADMTMRATLSLALASLCLMPGCTPSPVAGARAQAEEACLDRFSAITHLGTENLSTTDDDPDDNVAVSGPDFRIAATGAFAVRFPPITNLNHPYALRCTGDINRRLLTSVQIDGTLHRPAVNETWSF